MSITEKPVPSELGDNGTNATSKSLSNMSRSSAEGDKDTVPDDSVNHIEGLRLFLTTAALCMAVFCFALDVTIIATAIPRITDQFHSLQDIGWYGSAFLLTTCGKHHQVWYHSLYLMVV
jgi:hypothetical protein